MELGPDLWMKDKPMYNQETGRRRPPRTRKPRTYALTPLNMSLSLSIACLVSAVEGGSVQAAVNVLRSVKLYGEVAPPTGPEDPELVPRDEAKAWAADELKRQGRDADPFRTLLDPLADERDRLIELRMKQLRKERLQAET